MGHLEVFVVLLVAATLVAVVAHRIRLSYTLALLALGLVLGAFDLVAAPILSSEIILFLFLPPLLFEAAFVMDLRLLWSVRTGVLTLAFPGVLVAMIVGGSLVRWGLDLPWSVALLFGAIIAATDPVAVLATFRQLGVDRRLAVLLEGESLLNDGVALILVIVLEEAVDSGFKAASAPSLFVLSVVGGVTIGIATAWIGHVLITLTDDHLTEMSVSVALAYASYLAADSLHVSGVLATIFAAMTLGHLGRTRGWGSTENSELLLTDLWEYLAFAANAALFLLMGLTVDIAGLIDRPGSVLLGVGCALVGRAVVAYGFGAALMTVGFPLSWSERHVLFWGGLRGAVALAAALSLPVDFPRRELLLSMTYGAVLFTLIAQGLTIGPLANRLGLNRTSRSSTRSRLVPQ